MAPDPHVQSSTMSLGGASHVGSDVFEERDGLVRRRSWEYLLPADDLIEEENVWDADPDAVEVHWGLARTYDYFLSVHGRRGWDGSNGYTPAVVRYSTGVGNAFLWTSTGTLFFGDGASFGRPFTTLDIVAHEFGHLLTRDIIGLSRRGESASLDEALSDIFATEIAFQNDQGSWSIGSNLRPGGFRPLDDPQSRSMPDTYEGRHWEEYQTEAGFALGLRELTRHHNSTVGGYWFYLISEGGEGENDIEEEYEIEPIGTSQATDIVYRALFRLHPMADYESLREATIHVTRDLYGRCSEELRQVTNAWNAVGVGEPFCDCFEGSFIYLVDADDGPERIRFYVRGDDYAAEITADDGTTHIMNTTAGDPLRHVQGQPDISPAIPFGRFWQTVLQRRMPLLRRPSKPMTRREYLRYRNEHRTGRSRALGPYTTHEYRMEDTTVWSTEDVCMDITDFAGLLMVRTPQLADAMQQVLFGFPVRFSRPGHPRVWIEDLREHEVDDRVFRR